MSTAKYRPEIDGLRAIAVYAVLLFHAGFEGFSGGYTGVDIFFVISGFLITGIILQQHQNGGFSVLDFYERRARRILPALFMVLGFTTVWAWLRLYPSDMVEYGKSLQYVPAFLSNVFFARQSGYFDVASELKPLLHTWSLAVEEQFYVFFPLLLILIFRVVPRYLSHGILLCAFSSFLLAFRLVEKSQVAAFYLLPARTWELMVGAYLATLVPLGSDSGKSVPAQILSATGLLLLASGIVLFDKSTPFPGVSALVPTVGAALLIRFAIKGTFAYRFLSSSLMVRLGLISYSAYLLHQPLFALVRLGSISTPSVFEYLFLIILTTMLAWLSWRFVETPFRDRSRVSARGIALFSFAGSLLFAGVGYTIKNNDGFPDRFPDADKFKLAVEAREEFRKDCTAQELIPGFSITKCFLGQRSAANDSGKRILMTGDSHSFAMLPAVATAATKAGVEVLHMALESCPPLQGVDVAKAIYPLGVCPQFNSAVVKEVKARGIKTVILVGRWSMYTEGTYVGRKRDYWLVDEGTRAFSEQNSRIVFEQAFQKTAEQYAGMGVKLIVVSQVPEQKVPPVRVYNRIFSSGTQRSSEAQALIRELSVGIEEHRRLQAFSRQVMQRILEPHGHIWLELDTVFCEEGYCPMGSPDVPFYSDTNHAGYKGVLRAVHVFDSLLQTSVH